MEIENHIPSLNLNDDDVSKQAEIFKVFKEPILNFRL